MIGNILSRLVARLHRCALETPRSAFIHCGTDVTLAPYVTATYPDRVHLGNNIYIGPHAFLSSQGGLTIEDGVVIGPFLSVYTNNHRYEEAEAIPYDGVMILRPVTIKENVWVGGNAVILPGVTIGEGAIVAAGAVVVKDVPEMAVVGGNPAAVLKYRDAAHYQRLKREGKIYLRLKAAGAISFREQPG